MQIQIHKSGRKLTNEDIEIFCLNNGIGLPPDYKKFLLEYNGGLVSSNIFYYIDEYGDKSEACILDFSPLTGHKYDLQYNIDAFKDDIPPCYLPIAGDPCGNYVLLGISGDLYNKVYFFDHDLRPGIFPIIADDFHDFIENKLLPDISDEELPDPLETFIKECDTAQFLEKIKENKEFIYSCNSYGIALIVLLIRFKRLDLLKIVLTIDKSLVNGHGLVHVAVCVGREDILNFLLDQGADIEERASDNNTPLITATKTNELNCIKILLHRKANIYATNMYDQTFADWARMDNNQEIIEFLRSYLTDHPSLLKKLESAV